MCLVILEINTVEALYKEAVCGWDYVCQYPFMALSGGDMGMAGNTCVLLALGVVFLCEQDCTAMLLMC